MLLGSGRGRQRAGPHRVFAECEGPAGGPGRRLPGDPRIELRGERGQVVGLDTARGLGLGVAEVELRQALGAMSVEQALAERRIHESAPDDSLKLFIERGGEAELPALMISAAVPTFAHLGGPRWLGLIGVLAGGTLVLLDRWYPGWKVSVNGEPAELLRANGVFRAASIPAGQSDVEFRYAPMSLAIGGLSSALGLAGCLGLSWWSRREERRA